MTIELILGLDPSVDTIPIQYRTSSGWNLFDWGRDIMETCQHKIAGVKFQSAYFEMHGLKGLSAMSDLINDANRLKLKTIMDAKRGDIGSTSQAYAHAYLGGGTATHSDFLCDYLTINPLMGEDCLQPFIDVAITQNKGVFVLLETSNPGASMILKEQLTTQQTVSEKIAQYIECKHQEMGVCNYSVGPIGCVIGATNTNANKWRKKLPNSIFLMPGIGAQGGDWEVIKACKSHAGVWVPISRGITQVRNSDNAQYLYQVESNLNEIAACVKQCRDA